MKTIKSFLLAMCLMAVVNVHAVIDTFPYYNDIATAADVADWTLSGAYFSSSNNGSLSFYRTTEYCILPELDGDYMSIKATVSGSSDFEVYPIAADGTTGNRMGYLSSTPLNIPYGTKFIKIISTRNQSYVYIHNITINNSKLNPNTQWMVGDDIVATYETGGTLTLSGTGAMFETLSVSQYPYYNKFSYQTIIIEEGITSIGNYAFYDCDKATPPTLEDNLVFHNVNKGVSLLVLPSGSYANYAQTHQWRDFVFIVDLTYFSAALKSMSIDSQNLDEFDSGKFVYTYTVAYEVESITINAEAEIPGSTISGTGTFDLNVGLNVFVISVTAPDGVTTNYYSIGVTRQDNKAGIEGMQADKKLHFNSLVTDGNLRLFNFDSSQPIEIFNSAGIKLLSTSDNEKTINRYSTVNHRVICWMEWKQLVGLEV